jgi:trigger factor
MIDGQSLVGFSFEDNRCMLNLNLYNDANEPALKVVDNELTYSVDNWDVEFVGSTLTVREGLGEIFLEVEFSPPNLVRVPRGRLQYNGIEVEIRPGSLLVMNNATLISGTTAHGGATLLELGDNPYRRGPTAIGIVLSPSQRHAFDRAAARRFRRECMR